MHAPKIPTNEAKRVALPHELRVLDSSAEEQFDRYTRLAKRLFGVPIAAVSLVDADQQWFKSHKGLAAQQTSIELSFGGHAIAGEAPMVVPDAKLDARFADNPLVVGHPSVRFYAGAPLCHPAGGKLGTFCVIDHQPREFDEQDAASLADLAKMVSEELVRVSLSLTDDLTGLANRRGFEAVAAHVLSVAARAGTTPALACFDLDGLKPINDGYGHAAGDQVLQAFSVLLQQTFRESDVIARLGGDEFCALLNTNDPGQATVALDRLRAATEAHNASWRKPYSVRFSVGVAAAHEPECTVDALLERADKAMYADKRARRLALRTLVDESRAERPLGRNSMGPVIAPSLKFA